MNTCKDCDHLKTNRLNKTFPCFCAYRKVEVALPCTVSNGVIYYVERPKWCPIQNLPEGEAWRRYKKEFVNKHYHGASSLTELISRNKKHASRK